LPVRDPFANIRLSLERATLCGNAIGSSTSK
jgi:hypothetical protein